jgi:Na+-driven multidrug efflux pump
LPALAVLSFLIVFDGLQGVLMGALRGVADVILPMASYALAFWGCAVPLCYYLGYRQGGARSAWPGGWWPGSSSPTSSGAALRHRFPAPRRRF